MKTYEEMANDLFKRREEYLKKQNKRRRMINILSALVLSVCLISTFTVLSLQNPHQPVPVSTPNSIDAANNDASDSGSKAATGSSNTSNPGTSSPETSKPETSSPETSNPNNSPDNNENKPIILTGYDIGVENPQYLKERGIDAEQYDLSSYPKPISSVLAAFMEHYKNKNALYWVAVIEWKYGSFVTDSLPDQYKNFNALMTREEIFALADKLKDYKYAHICLAFDRNDKLLQYLDVSTYLLYLEAENTDYLPVKILYKPKLGAETALDGVTWKELISALEIFFRKMPASAIAKTNGYIAFECDFMRKCQISRYGIPAGSLLPVDMRFIGKLYFDYTGEEFLYSTSESSAKTPFSSKIYTDWFQYSWPSDAVRDVINQVQKNYESIELRRCICIYTVLTKAQITELILNSLTEKNLIISSCYSKFNNEIIEKCIPDYSWSNFLHFNADVYIDDYLYNPYYRELFAMLEN